MCTRINEELKKEYDTNNEIISYKVLSIIPVYSTDCILVSPISSNRGQLFIDGEYPLNSMYIWNEGLNISSRQSTEISQYEKRIGVTLHPKELQWILYRHVFAHICYVLQELARTEIFLKRSIIPLLIVIKRHTWYQFVCKNM